MTTVTKRRVIVIKLDITRLEKYKPVEIRLPANVKKVTGVLATASAV